MNRTSRGDRRGQSLVEFALVFPIFLMFVFAIIQLGLMFGGVNGITASVRDTARYASTYRVAATIDAQAVCPTVISHLRRELAKSIPGFLAARADAPSAMTASYSWLQNPDGPNGAPGSWYVEISVKVDYRYTLIVPLVGNLIDLGDGQAENPPALRITASESMRIENSPLAFGVLGGVPC